MTSHDVRALCGWIPPDKRTPEMDNAHDAIMQSLPTFSLSGVTKASPSQAFLWESWSHPSVLMATAGKTFGGFRQESGACVGAGGGTALFTLAAIEVAINNDPEIALIPFWPLPYGRSRTLAGMRGRGDGSIGSTFAKAMREDGVVASNEANLPIFTTDDQVFYGKAVEYAWSDGSAISSLWMEKAKVNKVNSVAPIRGHAEGVEALSSGYPITFCGDWGGMMRPPVKEGVLLNEHTDTWMHQQSCLGYMTHASFGLLFYIMNQWGSKTHGVCPTGAPNGGYWVKARDFDYQCRSGECFAWSLFDGFPARALDWRAVA